jgi:hypothetical protein
MDRSLADEVKREFEAWSVKDAARNRYPALRTIAGFFYSLSFMVLIFGAINICILGWWVYRSPEGAEKTLNAAESILLGCVTILVTLTWYLIVRAIAELIHVVIDIEKNTRDAAGKGG